MPGWTSRVSGFWRCLNHCTFFDVCIFTSFAVSNQSTTLAAAFRKHDAEKQHAYEERIREVKHGSFTPLVFSPSGGMRKASTTAYKHLAHLPSEKRSTPYSEVVGWLHCSFGFSLLFNYVHPGFTIKLQASRCAICNRSCSWRGASTNVISGLSVDYFT